MIIYRRIAFVFIWMAVLSQIASALLYTGVAHGITSYFRPDDPRRQLERSLIAAAAQDGKDIVVVGSSSFGAALVSSCSALSDAILVTVEGPRWRDYVDAARFLARRSPSRIIFQARPYMWTNIRIAWNAQRLNLLPGERMFRGIVSISSVRRVVDLLEEFVSPAVVPPSSGYEVRSFLGAGFSAPHGEVDRISRLLETNMPIKALIVLDPLEVPPDAPSEVREAILSEFASEVSFGPTVELVTLGAIVEPLGCNLDALVDRNAAALYQRQLPDETNVVPMEATR